MHLADEIIHGIELALGCMNYYINAITNHIQFRVGDEDCDFDKGIGR
jgi:hypothetical protein